MTDLSQKHCVPCEGGDPPLSEAEENRLIKEIHDWLLLREAEHKLRKQFKFKNFKEAMNFVNKIAKIADREGHHPDIYIFYNKVQIELFTHVVGGLSENDFIMVSKIDLIY